VSSKALEQLLNDLPRRGTLIKDRRYRQVWRFDFQGRAYYLKFYPRSGWKRIFRGNPASREFYRLQALQKARVAAPRAVAQLVGFKLQGVEGDAVILEAIEPALPLDQYVNQFLQAGDPIPNHYAIVQKIIELLHQLRQAKLGHDDLHLGNLMLNPAGEVFLLDGYAVRYGGLKTNDLLRLDHSVRAVATRADVQRSWNELGPGGAAPVNNPVSTSQWKKLIERIRHENRYFGKLRYGNWGGMFFKRYKYPRRWAPASSLQVTREEWDASWQTLWTAMQTDTLEILKRGASGDVLATELKLGGRSIPVVIKRPFKRYWYRYFNEIGRGSRSWRGWRKAWTLIVRDIPTAWPLAVMQRRVMGYITDSLVIFERLPGSTLGGMDLNAMTPCDRDRLFRRAGSILREIDDLGLSHFDAKAANWMVQMDDKLGPRPVLIDVDGIRFRRWRALGIQRLLRSMREHAQYTPADSLALCQGYSPFSKSMIRQEG
jgi:tRNA A-37 threonylcarbamoyl transferase component Bud32